MSKYDDGREGDEFDNRNGDSFDSDPFYDENLIDESSPYADSLDISFRTEDSGSDRYERTMAPRRDKIQKVYDDKLDNPVRRMRRGGEGMKDSDYFGCAVHNTDTNPRSAPQKPKIEKLDPQDISKVPDRPRLDPKDTDQPHPNKNKGINDYI